MVNHNSDDDDIPRGGLWSRLTIGAKVMSAIIGMLAVSLTFIAAHDDYVPASRGFVKVRDDMIRNELRKENLETKKELFNTQRSINNNERINLNNQLFDRQLQQRVSPPIDPAAANLLGERIRQLEQQIEDNKYQRDQLNEQLRRLNQ